MIALFGLCTPASSQERRPGLTRLNAEAEDALKKAACRASGGQRIMDIGVKPSFRGRTGSGCAGLRTQI
jgi:hypothetical protein